MCCRNSSRFFPRIAVPDNASTYGISSVFHFLVSQPKQLLLLFRRIETIIVEGKRSRERPRRTWEEQIKHDLYDLHFSEDVTTDRGSWRRLFYVFDYWYSFAYHLMFLFLPLFFLHSIHYSFYLVSFIYSHVFYLWQILHGSIELSWNASCNIFVRFFHMIASSLCTI